MKIINDIEPTYFGSNVDESLIIWIYNNIKHNSTVLEFGSGAGSTVALSKKYNVISIEDNINYINLYNSKYIHANIVDDWYDIEIIKRELQNIEYSFILVDGPAGEGNRWEFYTNIALFNTNIPIVIDDINRNGERKLFNALSIKLKKKKVIVDSYSKWGVLI
jgi:hypothetical protein